MAKYYTITNNFTFTTGQYNGMSPVILTPTLVRLEEGRSLDRWLANNTGYTEKTETEAKALWKTYVENEHDDDNRLPEYGTETSSMKVLTNIDELWEDING
tara:strand:+ start:26 stop:328 length:303 start_codon:yes stop_codon:yes gene_type:complete